MEGISGATCWDEMTKTHSDYNEFQEIFTNEVITACEAAKAAGASEVWVRDGHYTGRNILLKDLPDYVTIIRDWSGHPLEVLQELDDSFDAICLIGWHCRAGSENHPLAHTITLKIDEITINDQPASELLMELYAAEFIGVPVAFVSGNRETCEEAVKLNKNIITRDISYGLGSSTVSLSPAQAQQAIRKGVIDSLSRQDLQQCRVTLPQKFDVKIRYADPYHAYRFSWYPGAEHIGDRTIQFKTDDYFEVLRFQKFVT